MKTEFPFRIRPLQYEGRARLSCLASDQRSSGRLACPRTPQVQVLGFNYIPMQLVAPRAVTIAVAIDAIICTMNFNVSLLVMVF